MIFAWPSVASAALFSKKKKDSEPVPVPSEGIDLEKLNERLRSMEAKVQYVGDDVHEVVDRVDSVREGVQDVDWIMGNMNENIQRLEEKLSELQAGSTIVKNEMKTEAQRLLASIEKEQGKASTDINQKLDVMTRNFEALSESLARVHHLLAIGSMMNTKPTAANLPSPGGPPPPPPPPPPFFAPPGPPAPPLPTSRSTTAKTQENTTDEGFEAVLNQIRSSAPQKRLRKTGSKFVIQSSDSSSNSADDELQSESD